MGYFRIFGQHEEKEFRVEWIQFNPKTRLQAIALIVATLNEAIGEENYVLWVSSKTYLAVNAEVIGKDSIGFDRLPVCLYSLGKERGLFINPHPKVRTLRTNGKCKHIAGRFLDDTYLGETIGSQSLKKHN